MTRKLIAQGAALLRLQRLRAVPVRSTAPASYRKLSNGCLQCNALGRGIWNKRCVRVQRVQYSTPGPNGVHMHMHVHGRYY